MDKTELLQQYIKGYELLINTIDPLPRDVFDFKTSPESWSLREIVAHIVDCEANTFTRLRTAIAENGKLVTPYDQNKWADSLFYQIQGIDDNLELFKLLRRSSYKILLNLPDKAWNNYFSHPERGNLTVEDHIQESINHVDSHIKQIIRNYENWEAQTKIKD